MRLETNTTPPPGTSFSGKLLNLLDHVEYRRVETGEDMEEIARLRYRAYKSADIMPMSGSRLIDDVDFDPQAYVFGVYYDEQLISTVRIHHATPDHRVSSTGDIFPEPLNAFLDAGMSFIDPARFAADPEILGEMPGIPYITLRIATMAADYFNADRVIQMVANNHAAFYRRIFEAKVIGEPIRHSEKYHVKITLLSTDVPNVLQRLYRRYPFFCSEACERRMMFSRSSGGYLPALNILPTARFALKHLEPLKSDILVDKGAILRGRGQTVV